MENIKETETDYRKWLAFSQTITSSTRRKEFYKAIRRKKSYKSVKIISQKGKEEQYYIQEHENPITLVVDKNSIVELISYFNNAYNQDLSNSPILGPRSNEKKYSQAKDRNLPKYLYYESKFKHTLTFSFYTLLALQFLLIPKFIMNLEFPFDSFLRYPISFAGLFLCLRYYKRFHEYDLNFSEFFSICWLFSTLLFFLYFSEVTLLSIPAEIPNVTWTSMVYLGTLFLGALYLLVSSFITALIFYLAKRLI